MDNRIIQKLTVRYTIHCNGETKIKAETYELKGSMSFGRMTDNIDPDICIPVEVSSISPMQGFF